MVLIMKEVILIMEGDSSDINSWSNVPYFFSQELINRGIKVHRVNIKERGIFSIICKLVGRIHNICAIKTVYGVKNTALYQYIVSRKISKIQKELKDSDCCILLNYDYCLPKTDKMKTVLFSDWPANYYLSNHLNRKPSILENRTLRIQNTAINSADVVVTLFPRVYKYMNQHYPRANIHYIGNVINAFRTPEEITVAAEEHYKGDTFLFIGRKNYISGAVNLIETINKLNCEKNTNYKVAIIGLEKADFEPVLNMSAVTCYGFLRKNNIDDCEIYYNLLRKCKAVVNTTENWAGASSLIEALSFGCPLIVSPFLDFVDTFGSDIQFGYYCSKNNSEHLNKCIEKLLLLSELEYFQMCNNAQNSVKDFTWPVYMEKLIDLIENS